jgi:hypothetical protein
MSSQKELKAKISFQRDVLERFSKMSFLFWYKKISNKNQLTHFESKELWVKIKNSLQLFN